MAVAALKPKTADRLELCERLLKLRRKHADAFNEMDEMKSQLIEIAARATDGYREVVPGEGTVSVSAPHDKEFKGHVPEVDAMVFDALSEVRRAKLIDAGIIKITPHFTKASYGRVVAKLF